MSSIRKHQIELAVLREEKRKLRKSLREMLDAYWGRGDGDDPPDFIKLAAKLSGYSLDADVSKASLLATKARREKSAAQAYLLRTIANMTPYKFDEEHGGDGSWTDDQAEDAITCMNKLIEEAGKVI